MNKMNRKSILTAVLCLSVLTATAQQRADQQRLEDPRSFSMIVMGDPQGYSKYDINQPILELCTAWIADNIDSLGIRAVMCTGDLVEMNECITPNPAMSNQTSTEQWESVSRSFGRLDGHVPYIIATGNHDYGYVRGDEPFTHFPDYFPVGRNPRWKGCLVSTFPNREGNVSLENAAFEFEEGKWGKILVVSTEWAPRDEVLEWVRTLADGDYKSHRIILLTHSYMHERTAQRTQDEDYRIMPRNYGQEIWDKLVYPTTNIELVVCGHNGHPGDFEDTVAYRVDKNSAGRRVHQMMFNIQCSGGGWEGNGGDGWLRILEFKPDGRTIAVRTYSPLFGISPSTRHLAHRTAACDQFEMVLDK